MLPRKTTDSSSTDVFNRIYNEDCTVGLNRIPDGSVDLVVMDPPYEMDNAGGGVWFND